MTANQYCLMIVAAVLMVLMTLQAGCASYRIQHNAPDDVCTTSYLPDAYDGCPEINAKATKELDIFLQPTIEKKPLPVIHFDRVELDLEPLVLR